MKAILSSLAILLIFISSCKKDEEIICPPTPAPKNYMPLAIGNYWVYNTYRIDTNGVETKLPPHDSLVITKDTMINNETYYVVEGTFHPFQNQWGIYRIIKNDHGNIISHLGDTILPATDYTATFREHYEIIGNNDTLYHRVFQTVDPPYEVTVPAGTFSVLDYRGTYTTYANIPNVPNPRYVHNYYADNVGKVKQTYHYISSYQTFEIRLVDYSVIIAVD
ncbi:hypothetical protein KFE94_16055 [bacterium SCSIO 12643]|nr:hypothetical protein KFE94_16055 [bacterium SCSIO 12643]